MKVIKDVSFISFEFDFGEEGKINASIFVEIDNNGEKQKIQHQVELQDVSFLDFMTQNQIDTHAQVGDSFSTFIQSLRTLIIFKVASDLGVEVADIDYVPTEPLRDRVDDLEVSQTDQDDLIMNLMLGGA